jgi:DNA ligase (NAD+)
MDLDDQQKETTVKYVQWKISKMGKYIPIIHFEPIEIESNEGSKSTIKKCSGHNAKYIIDNSIGKGAKIIIIKSNDVIPKVFKILEKGEINYPEQDYMWNHTKIHFITTEQTEEQNINRIISFFKTMDTEHFGPGVIKKAFEQGLTNICKILNFTKEDFSKLDGFKEKKAEKVYNSIQKAYKNAKLYHIVAGSNIFPNLGIKNAKLLCDNVDILQDELKVDMITSIKGFGKISSQIIVDNIMEFKEFLNKLPNSNKFTQNDNETSKISVKNELVKNKQESTEKLIQNEIVKDEKGEEENKKVNVFHIAMSGTRDKKLMKWVEDNGGVVHSGVTKKVQYLVVKNKKYRVTKKTKDAVSKGIQIIQIDEFKKKYKMNL